MQSSIKQETFLISILSIDLILERIAPFLPFPDIQNLSSVSKSFRALLRENPWAYRRLDLSIDGGTSDTLFQAFSRSTKALGGILRHARVLILDSQVVDIDFLRTILLTGDFQVRLLSILDVKDLDWSEWSSIVKLISLYAELVPEPRRLRGIYMFGLIKNIDSTLQGKLHQHNYKIPANVYNGFGPYWRNVGFEQMALLLTNPGQLMYNAVLCRGSRHDVEINIDNPLSPALASWALGARGCEKCGTFPEGPGSGIEQIPLSDPPPYLGHSLDAASKPPVGKDGCPAAFYARCSICLGGLVCNVCSRIWCEQCAPEEFKLHPNEPIRPCAVCQQRGLCSPCRVANYRICIDCNHSYCPVNCAESLDEEFSEETLKTYPNVLPLFEKLRKLDLCWYCFADRVDRMEEEATQQNSQQQGEDSQDS